MRVLSVHNYYQRPGGEDAVFEAEASLLREHGHEVDEFTRTNAEISNGGRLKRRRGPCGAASPTGISEGSCIPGAFR